MDTRQATESVYEEEFLAGNRSQGSPLSSPRGLVFPLHPTHSFYSLQKVDIGLFAVFLQDSGYSETNVLQVLSQLKRVLAEPSSNIEDQEIDDLPEKSLWVAAGCFAIFFALLIASAYYTEEDALAAVGAGFAGVGLIVSLGLVVLDGDCRRVKRLVMRSSYTMPVTHRRHIQDLFAIVNKDLTSLGLHWKLGDLGRYVALRRFK